MAIEREAAGRDAAKRDVTAQQAAEIRRAGPGEWRVYRELRLAALAEAPYAFSSTLERELAFDDELWQRRLSSSAVSFLAWRGAEPVGMATGKIDDPGDEFAVAGAWQLVGMWVSPAARGLGVADGLVEAVARHARAAGAKTLVLWVTEVNGRAQALYRRLGFAPTGARQPVRPDEPASWEVQLLRPLG
ncbi:MAG TPA: GNAT family N-acetyltransferase [Streptosporangiaceae bacterium]|nr:GNAT family N-acetyltransferase [Streptosporangiaceae bacterium]